MPKFTKKPVEIEARQFDGTQDGAKAMCEWMAEHGCEALRAFCGHDEPYQVYISTLEGRMTASAGDWIIRGVKGEFYPCKPDIFAETYETSALSHAAGQDGEQCRAASGDGEAWKVGMFDRWNEYAQQLGYTGMCDALSSIPELRALSRGVPEGMVLVQKVDAVRLARFGMNNAGDGLRSDVKLSAMRVAAIAAQRKEGA